MTNNKSGDDFLSFLGPLACSTLFSIFELVQLEKTGASFNPEYLSTREPVVEDNSHSDKWGLRNLIPVLVVEVQKVRIVLDSSRYTRLLDCCVAVLKVFKVHYPSLSFKN